MATLNELKERLEEAASLKKIGVCGGEKNQVLIDLNGDGQPEAALIDTTDSGSADLLALDLTGDHKFNLYLDDTDDNAFPDVAYIDKKGDGNLQLLHIGESVRDNLHGKLVKIYATLTDPSTEAVELHDALYDLGRAIDDIKKARKF